MLWQQSIAGYHGDFRPIARDLVISHFVRNDSAGCIARLLTERKSERMDGINHGWKDYRRDIG
jgi:hypothetical protein